MLFLTDFGGSTSRIAAGAVGGPAGLGVAQCLFLARNPDQDHAVMQKRNHHAEECGFLAAMER